MNDTQNRELIDLAFKGYTVRFDNDNDFIYISSTDGYGEIQVSDVLSDAPSLKELPDNAIWRDKLNNQVVIG